MSDQWLPSGADMAERLGSDAEKNASAAENALDEIAKACGCPEWDYPGQVVRDVLHVVATRNLLESEKLVNGHDVRWWKAAWDRATEGRLDGYHELGAKVAAAEEARDTARAELARLVQEHGRHVNEASAEIRRLEAEVERAKQREVELLREAALQRAGWRTEGDYLELRKTFDVACAEVERLRGVIEAEAAKIEADRLLIIETGKHADDAGSERFVRAAAREAERRRDALRAALEVHK